MPEFDLATAIPITDSAEKPTLPAAGAFDLNTAMPRTEERNSYTQFLKSQWSQQLKDAFLNPIDAEQVKVLTQDETQKPNRLQAFMQPYAERIVGFVTKPFGYRPRFDRPFGLEKGAPTKAETQEMQDIQKEYPVEFTLGQVIGGMAPFIATAPIFPQSLLGTLLTFETVGITSTVGKQQTEESLLTTGFEKSIELGKDVVKTGIMAPVWYYSRDLKVVGKPFVSAMTRAAFRGTATVGLEDVFGTDLSEALRQGGVITALSLMFEVPTLAKTALGRGILKRADTLMAQTKGKYYRDLGYKEASGPTIDIDKLDEASTRASLFDLVKGFYRIMRGRVDTINESMTPGQRQTYQRILTAQPPADMQAKPRGDIWTTPPDWQTQPMAGGMTTGREIPPQITKWMEKGVDIIERQAPIRITDPEAKIKDINGNVVDLPTGHEMTPYKLSNGKIWLHDGKDVVVESGQLQNLANKNLVLGEGKFTMPEGIEEVVKGSSFKSEVQKITRANDTVYRAVIESDRGFTDKNFTTEEEANNWLKERRHDVGYAGETKFQGYQLPGGEDYEEVVIKAQSEKIKEKFSVLQEKGSWYIKTPFGDLGGPYETEDKAIEIAKMAQISVDEAMLIDLKAPVFKSSHWDEPNPLAHFRGNIRTTPDGKKVYFVEEIQSDWARQGREKGFIKEKYTDDEILSLAKDSGWNLLQEKNTWWIGDKDSTKYDHFKSKEEAIRIGLWREIKDKINKGVPFHPLLKSWQELALKSIIKRAIAKGADYISWTTGEQQAERYDLSKQINSVHYLKNPDGTVSIKAYPINDNGLNTIKKTVPENEVSQVIGKDLAEKIKVGPSEGMFSGMDLRVGGEWAKNLYDKQIPNILKDLTKGEITEIEIAAPLVFKGQRPDAGKGDFPGIQPAIKITPEIKALVIGQPAAGGMPPKPPETAVSGEPAPGEDDQRKQDLALLNIPRYIEQLVVSEQEFMKLYIDAGMSIEDIAKALDETPEDVKKTAQWTLEHLKEIEDKERQEVEAAGQEDFAERKDELKNYLKGQLDPALKKVEEYHDLTFLPWLWAEEGNGMRLDELAGEMSGIGFNTEDTEQGAIEVIKSYFQRDIEDATAKEEARSAKAQQKRAKRQMAASQSRPAKKINEELKKLTDKIKELRVSKALSNVTVSRLRRHLGITELKNTPIDVIQKLVDYMETLKTGDKLLSDSQREAITKLFGDIENLDIMPKRIAIERFGMDESILNKGVIGLLPLELLPTVDIKEGNPVVAKIVEEATQKMTNAESEIQRRDNAFELMLRKAQDARAKKLSLKERTKRALVKEDIEIFKALSGQKVDLTKEEIAVVAYLKNFFEMAKKKLKLEKYRSRYVTHLEQPLMEKIIQRGIIGAVKQYFDEQSKKKDLATDIMLELDNIIGSTKFFRFALKRKGGITPTTNIQKILHDYSTLFETKVALDSILPVGQTAAKLLLEGKDALWMKKFLQNLKGRALDNEFRTGRAGWLVKVLDGIIDFSYIKLLGLNYWSAIKNIVAGETNAIIWQDFHKYLSGKQRLFSNPSKAYRLAVENNILEGTYADYSQRGIGKWKALQDKMMFGQQFGEVEIRASMFCGELTEEEWKKGEITSQRWTELKDMIAITQGIFSKVESPLFVQTFFGRMLMQMNRWRITDAMLLRRIITGAKQEWEKGNFKGKNTDRFLKTILFYGTGMYIGYQLRKAGLKKGAQIAEASAEVINGLVSLVSQGELKKMLTDNPTYSMLKEFFFTLQDIAATMKVPGAKKPQTIDIQEGIDETFIAPLKTLDDLFDLTE